MTFSQENCFLCGEDISPNNTQEHIFPKWLQKRYNLWNQTFYLLNGTELQYQRAKIPCCNSCNGNHLSQIENQISQAVRLGYEEFIKLDEDLVFYWAAKILYGLFFKELSLNVDRSNPVLGTITTPEIMERFKTLHLVLQGTRKLTQYEPVKPYSLFIFRTQQNGDPTDFDYMDDYHTQVYAMRMGDIGFVICLEDSSVQRELFRETYEKYKDKTLHPIQLREIFAKIHYKQTLANFAPKYLVIEGEESDSGGNRVVWVNQPSGELFDDWSMEMYGHYLAHYLASFHLEFEDLFVPPNLVRTYLEDTEGDFLDIPKEAIFKQRDR